MPNLFLTIQRTQPGAPARHAARRVRGHVDAAEQLWSLQAVKVERQRVAVVHDADRDVSLPVGQVHRLIGGQHLHLDLGMKPREVGEVRHEQVCCEGRRQRHPQKAVHALAATEDARLQPVR